MQTHMQEIVNPEPTYDYDSKVFKREQLPMRGTRLKTHLVCFFERKEKEESLFLLSI